MKATNLVLVGLGALLVLRKIRGAAGVGHPADYYTPQDYNDYVTYLEAYYGEGFTPAELRRNERARLEILEEAAREHERRTRAQQQHIVEMKRQRSKAEAQAAFDTYVHYLNNKYGRGFNPGLIDPTDSEFYYKLKKDIV